MDSDTVIIGGLLGAGLLLSTAKGETVGEKVENITHDYTQGVPSTPSFNLFQTPAENTGLMTLFSLLGGLKDTVGGLQDKISTLQIPDATNGDSIFKLPTIPTLPDFTPPKLPDNWTGSINQNFNNALDTTKFVAGAYVGGKTAQAIGRLATRKTTHTIIKKTAVKALVTKATTKTLTKTALKGAGRAMGGIIAGEVVGNVAVNLIQKSGFQPIPIGNFLDKHPTAKAADSAIRKFAGWFRW